MKKVSLLSLALLSLALATSSTHAMHRRAPTTLLHLTNQQITNQDCIRAALFVIKQRPNNTNDIVKKCLLISHMFLAQTSDSLIDSPELQELSKELSRLKKAAESMNCCCTTTNLCTTSATTLAIMSSVKDDPLKLANPSVFLPILGAIACSKVLGTVCFTCALDAEDIAHDCAHLEQFLRKKTIQRRAPTPQSMSYKAH